jgi:hypothetical protein|tara:strand:+ start:4300 stop:6774 length:2475 start_codon:yes stop_codon:yes gene_type:complete
MPRPPLALIDGLPDELLALIFAAAAAPDRLRCEQVSKRWREVLTRREFTEHLVIPGDCEDDCELTETTPDGWTINREQARNDLFIAAAEKVRGRLRTLDVSNCSEITHDAVIRVLRANANMRHLKMNEKETSSYRLRLRPRQLVDAAHGLGNRACADEAPSTLSASVEVVGNEELESLRDVVVKAARQETSTSTSTSPPSPLVIRGTHVTITSLTISLLFLERVLLPSTAAGNVAHAATMAVSPGASESDNDEAFDADDDANEDDPEASVARETARVTATHLVEIIQTLGPRGLARINFGERSLVDARGAHRILRALREHCDVSLREIHVDGEPLQDAKTKNALSRAFTALARKGGARRVVIHRAWLEFGESSPVAIMNPETWKNGLGFGMEKICLEAPHEPLMSLVATRDVRVDVLSFAKPPGVGRRQLRSARHGFYPPKYCTGETMRIAEVFYSNVSGASDQPPRYFDMSNSDLAASHLSEVLSAIEARKTKAGLPASMKVLSISGNGKGGSCPCHVRSGRCIPVFCPALPDALAGAIDAQTETLVCLDIGELPTYALARAIPLVARLPVLNTLDLSGTPMGASGKKRTRQSDGADDEVNDEINLINLARLLGDALGTSGCRLRTLLLVECSLIASQLRDIVAGAVKTSSVTRVFLSYNSQLGNDGCEVVARWIRGGGKKAAARIDPDARGGTLLSVHLEGCGISDVGAKTIAAAVSENRALRILDLASNNWIGAAGRKALVEAARNRPGIWTKETVQDTPWAGSDTDEYDDDVYNSEDDGYFEGQRHANERQSQWSLEVGDTLIHHPRSIVVDLPSGIDVE